MAALAVSACAGRPPAGWRRTAPHRRARAGGADQAGALAEGDGHALAHLQGVLVGLHDGGVGAAVVHADDELHGLAGADGVLHQAAAEGAHRRAQHAAHRARAPVAADGGADDAAGHAAAHRAQPALRAGDVDRPHADDGAVFECRHLPHGIGRHGAVHALRRAGGEAEREQQGAAAEEGWAHLRLHVEVARILARLPSPQQRRVAEMAPGGHRVRSRHARRQAWKSLLRRLRPGR
jgi:hypothetical protein